MILTILICTFSVLGLLVYFKYVIQPVSREHKKEKDKRVKWHNPFNLDDQ